MSKHQIERDLEEKLYCALCDERYATMEDVKDGDCRVSWTEWLLALLLVAVGIGGWFLMYWR